MDATYRISEEDYVRACQLASRMTPRAGALLFAAAVALALLALWGPPSLRAGAIGGLVGGVTVLVVHRFIYIPIVFKRMYRKHRSIHDKISISLDESGIRIVTDDWNGIYKWDKILKWRHNKDYILLYLNPRLFVIIPKSIEKSGFNLASLIAALQAEVGNESRWVLP